MHPREEHVVPQVTEMRDAALLWTEVLHRRRQGDRAYAAPAEAHCGFRVEIETAHERLPLHDLEQRSDGIHAESVERVADSGAQRLEAGEPVRDLAPQHAFQGRGRVE